MIDFSSIDEKIEGHVFEGVNWQNIGIEKPSNKSWEGITQHHSKKDNIDILILNIADRIASGISRTLSRNEKIKKKDNTRSKRDTDQQKIILKLWNQDEEKIKLFSSMEEFKKIIDFIKVVRNGESYLESDFFHKKLLLRPEDFEPPKNITSLYIHSKLVGKLYYFFKSFVTENLVTEKNGLICLEKSKEANKINIEKNLDIKRNTSNAEEQWDIKLVYCKIKFPHYPARVKDLNLFEVLKEELVKLSNLNNVILQTSDQFLTFLPIEEKIGNILKSFLDRGFQVYVEEAHTKLGNAYPTPKAIRKRALQSRGAGAKELDGSFPIFSKYKDLKSTLDKTVCEVCQMQPSECNWVDEESGIIEHLCNNCCQIRKFREEPPAPKLDLWYKEEPRSKIAWIKINLDIQLLAETLQDLLDKYVQEIIKDEISEKIELRFSVLAEFHHDHELFLKDFNEELKKKFSEENLQPILDDFICVKLDKTSQIKDILEIYNNLFTNYFPELREQKSPITLSISVSNVKFAFFRHWKILENPVDDVNVALVGRGEMHLHLNQLGELIENFRIPSSKQLHKLAKISETSEKLAKVLVYGKGDYRVYNDLKPIREAKDKKIDFKTILTYAKIMEDVDEVS